jgi:hypothetical protein
MLTTRDFPLGATGGFRALLDGGGREGMPALGRLDLGRGSVASTRVSQPSSRFSRRRAVSAVGLSRSVGLVWLVGLGWSVGLGG